MVSEEPLVVPAIISPASSSPPEELAGEGMVTLAMLLVSCWVAQFCHVKPLPHGGWLHELNGVTQPFELHCRNVGIWCQLRHPTAQEPQVSHPHIWNGHLQAGGCAWSKRMAARPRRYSATLTEVAARSCLVNVCCTREAPPFICPPGYIAEGLHYSLP